jgi:tetratricopeptide (TPR) repeat protein
VEDAARLRHPEPLAELALDYPLALSLIHRLSTLDLPQAPAAVWRMGTAIAAYQELNGLLGDWDQHQGEIMEAARRTGEPDAEAIVLTATATMDLARGELSSADKLYRAAFNQAERLVCPAAAAWALIGIANALTYQDRLVEARQSVDAALDRIPSGEAGVWGNGLRTKATIARRAGNPMEALNLYNDCLQIETYGDLWRAAILHDLALCQIDLQQLAQAEATLKESARLFTATQSRPWQAAVMRSLASVYRMSGRLTEALVVLQRARDAFQEIGDRRWEGFVLCDISAVTLALGRPAEARRALREAQAAFARTGDNRGILLLAERLAALDSA